MRQTDLLVVGAGPAGMAAAIAARRAGLEVIVADENAEPGGQIYRRALSNAARPERLELLGADYAQGLALAREFVDCGADIRPRSTVFEISDNGSASIVGPGNGAYVVRPRATLIATGAIERAFPVPGWTLPGVMTAGAAQTLLKSGGQVPEGRIVLAGAGPLLWLVAWQLATAGADVAAVLSFARASDYLRNAGNALAAWRSLGTLAKGASWIARLRSRGVKIVHGARIAAIESQGSSRAVHYVSRGGRATQLADVVLLHAGVTPNVQASRSLRIEHEWNAAQSCWQPCADHWAVSRNPRILVAGDGAGIAGAQDAARGGELAALGLAARLGAITAEQRDQRAAPLVAARQAQRALRVFLDALYAPPQWLLAPVDDETLVCRCEQVNAGAIRAAVKLGAEGPNQVKAFVRAGMGACQGRSCAQTVASLIARERGIDSSRIPTQQVRPPLKPIHIADLAAIPADPGEDGVPPIIVSLLHAPEDDASGSQVDASH